jgi:hypothetical protein
MVEPPVSENANLQQDLTPDALEFVLEALDDPDLCRLAQTNWLFRRHASQTIHARIWQGMPELFELILRTKGTVADAHRLYQAPAVRARASDAAFRALLAELAGYTSWKCLSGIVFNQRPEKPGIVDGLLNHPGYADGRLSLAALVDVRHGLPTLMCKSAAMRRHRPAFVPGINQLTERLRRAETTIRRSRKASSFRLRP